jgi:hypothetical protein
MAIQHKPHIHSGHGGPYESTFVYDDAAGSQPGLLLFPNFFGAKQWDIDKAAVLTQLGYKVLVVDYYGQGKRGTDMESSAVLMQKFTADRAAMRGQLLDALSELRKLPGGRRPVGRRGQGQDRRLAVGARRRRRALPGRPQCRPHAGHRRQDYKLALLPSGVVRGKLSVIGNGVVVDPWHFWCDEIEKLRGRA